MLLQRATVTHSRFQLKITLIDSLKTTDINFDLKRKRIGNGVRTDYSSQYTDEPCRKRRRIRTEPLGSEDATKQYAGNRNNDRAALVYHWVQVGGWPKNYFEPDEGTTSLLGMHQLMISFPALLGQRSDVADAPRPCVDPFFLIT